MTISSTAHPATDLIMRKLDIDQDAALLADMWNASDDQWPGTWNRGVPMTAAMARDWQLRQKSIDTLVWDTGTAFAGYCSFWASAEEPDVTYIALLNVAPAYQGYSLGRKFLVHFVQRSVELGATRLDLGTWSGNLKAVPLYKKCGFCWVPGTSVQMWNFMPTILALPCARPFFARHNWYQALKRTLAQSEDNEQWEGMRVFTYHFEAADEHLTVWIDREARRVTAIETNEFSVAAIASNIEPPRGLPTTLRWRLCNKRDRPMAVTLIATGNADLKLNHRATLQVAPGETVNLEAPVAINSTMADTDLQKRAPSITSLLLVDGEVIELGTGLRPRAAVEVSTYPDQITLMPNVQQTVRLHLRSHVPQALTATLSLTPEAGLTSDWTEQRVTLNPEGEAGLPLTLHATRAGVLALPINLSLELAGETIHLPVSNVQIFARPLGGVLAAHQGDSIRIENETMRLIIKQKGATIAIQHPISGEQLAEHIGYAAPPAWPNEFTSGIHALVLEQHGDRVIVTTTMESRESPGFVLRKQISANASPLWSIEYDFENRGSTPYHFHTYQWISADRAQAMLTLPLAPGLGRGPWEDFPGREDDEFKQARAYAERWGAIELPQATIGVFWPEDIEEILFGWEDFKSRSYSCPPQSRVRPGAMQIYVGTGDWRSVQQLWQRLQGQPTRQLLREPQPPLSARFEPAVIVGADGTAQSTLLIEHLRSRPLDVNAYLLLPEGWRSDIIEVSLPNFNWQCQYRRSVQFTTTMPPGIASGRIAIRSDEIDIDVDLPLLRLSDGRVVDVRETRYADQPVFTIANGQMEIDITPGFGGTISAVRTGNVNHLASPFPEVATIGWMSPWHGGLMPVLRMPGERNFPGDLWQQRFSATPIAYTDTQGIIWRGVRQQAELSEAKWRGLCVELDTLTPGGSSLLKLVFRLVNNTPLVRKVQQAGWLIFVQPDGNRANTVLWGAAYPLKPSERMVWMRSSHWVAAQNPATGRTLTLLSPHAETGVVSWGSDGNHGYLLAEQEVPAYGSVELRAYMILTDNLEEARRYRGMKDFFSTSAFIP